MLNMEYPQDSLVRELAEELVQALHGEYRLLDEEGARLGSLVSEAAEKLRRNFREIDNVVRENVDMEFLLNVEEDYQDAYRDVVAALQFEDLVCQIVSHQRARAEATRSLLTRMAGALAAVTEPDGWETGESEMRQLRREVNAALAQFPGSSAVRQESLAVGETELF